MNIFEIIILSIPLISVLFSLALMPIVMPKFWSKNEGKVFLIISIISILLTFSMLCDAKNILKHSLIEDYVPFIIMLFTLYVLSNGIHINIKASSSTMTNIIFLGSCCIFSSIIGTTGASVLFLRSFLDINEERKYKTHLIIFFIFLVSNIGGLLTPLGDPPLLLGYLKGIEFSWCIKNLFFYWFSYIGICLMILYVIDKLIIKKEKIEIKNIKFSIKIRGGLNIFLIISTVIVLFSEINYKFILHLPDICNYVIPNICIKNLILLIFCSISLYLRKSPNEKIDLHPFKEVAVTFLVIFIVIAPVLFIIEKNSESIQKIIINISNGGDVASIYFWMCSLASSFLDNAPSYLLFFNMAGGNSQELMNVCPGVLKAISVSSVVMGCMTYIGNAPNMLVKAIATKRGIKMPSFVGYLCWSLLIILPVSFLMVFIMTK